MDVQKKKIKERLCPYCGNKSEKVIDEQNNLYESKCGVVFDEYGNDFTRGYE